MRLDDWAGSPSLFNGWFTTAWEKGLFGKVWHIIFLLPWLTLAPVSPAQSSMLWVGRLGAKTFNVRRQALFGWCFFPLQCVILAYNHTPTNKVIVHYWNEAGRLSRITKSFQRLVHNFMRKGHLLSSAVAHFGPCISCPEFHALGGTSRCQDFQC